jgi:TonB-dependent starch-binding outer membrane protein SusC
MSFGISVLARGCTIATALLLTLGASMGAQTTGSIRGRVTEAGTGRPISDVQVNVVGLPLSSGTTASGEFTIAGVPAGTHQVAARRLGFARQVQPVTVTTGVTARLDFVLNQAASQLEAVVVTGTAGEVERRTLGNSITQLDVADLTSKMSMQNVTDVLQSKTPGVTILPGSGAPGTAGEIRIRGASSISGYKPVVFIDGIRFNIDDIGAWPATGGGTAGLAQSSQTTSLLNSLNPNDIESIEVVKGPAAATLYGAEAANGVIQIITKKGSRGQQRMSWTVRTETGRSEWKLIPDDNYTTCDAAKQALLDPQGNPVWPGCQGLAVNTVITDNPLRRDARALRNGQLSRFNINTRGGGDRYSFYLSGDRSTEDGVFHNSFNGQTSVRANFSFSPSNKSDIQLTSSWQSGRLRLPVQDESANGILLSARRGLAGRASLLGTGNEGWRTIGPDRANQYKNFTNNDRFIIGGTVNYTPISWFQNRFTVGFDNNISQAQLLFLPGDIEVGQDPDAASGANYRRTPTRRVLTLDYAGSLRWDANADIATTTRFGSQVVADKTETLTARGIGIGAPDVTLVDLLQRNFGGEAFSENNSVGYFVQEQVDWRNRLTLTAAVRADDHSSFGKNFDMIIYPKVSVAYVASEEPAMRPWLDAARVNSLKLRTAWGQAGRAPSAYSAPQTYTVDRVTLGTATGSALRTAAFGNPDLKPERGVELELGFDMGMFDDRLGVDFTYYNKTTKDMLQFISVPPSTGFISSRLTNLGEVNNRGIEVSFFGTPYRSRPVTWEARMNVSTNRNRLMDFGVPDKVLETPGGQPYGVVQQHRPGYPLGGYWVTPPLRCGVDPLHHTATPCPRNDGSPQLTAAAAAIFNPGDTARRYIGPSQPTREIGFSNTVTLFGRARVYALLDQKTGHYLFNLQERNRCQAANDNCARVNNPRARFPQTAADTTLFRELSVYRSTTNVSPEWIQKADFIKLREVSLTVDLPQRLLGYIRSDAATLILSGRNLAVWSDYEGVDPEVNTYGGRNFVRVDAYASPMTRRYTAALQLQF